MLTEESTYEVKAEEIGIIKKHLFNMIHLHNAHTFQSEDGIHLMNYNLRRKLFKEIRLCIKWLTNILGFEFNLKEQERLIHFN